MRDSVDKIAINQAFTAQSVHYDHDDASNHVISDLRQQVYEHVDRFIHADSHILELNAGTGIDAVHLVSSGHRVLATDLSDGMIAQLNKKANERLRVKQISYDDLDLIGGQNDDALVPGSGFDYIFSNFGGLNCIDDLGKVTKHVPRLLKRGGYVTWVVMPKICPWEIASILKGNRNAFRRLKRNGVMAHIDGEYFRTWYHSLTDIKNAFGDKFEFIQSEGLAALSPPPHKTRTTPHNFLRRIDKLVNRTFPFDRWADHIIVTFRLK